MKVTQNPLTDDASLHYKLSRPRICENKKMKRHRVRQRIVATYAAIAGRAALSTEIDLVIGGTKQESIHG